MMGTFEDAERAKVGRSQGRMDRRGTNKRKVGLKKVCWNVMGRSRRGRRKGELAGKGVVEFEEKLGWIIFRGNGKLSRENQRHAIDSLSRG
jgi:hypothetical protein